MIGWSPTRIEELQVFDVVIHAYSVWVIHRISHNSDGQTFYVTKVDDGKQGKWYFMPQSHGYLIEKRTVS